MKSAWLEHHLDAAIFFVPERLVGRGGIVERDAMRDDERRVDDPRLDLFQQWLGVTRHVRLAHSEGDAFVHRGAKRDLVQQANVDARDRDGAGLPAAHDRFTEHVRAIRPQHHGGFRLVQDRVETAAAVRFGPDRIDTAVRPATVGHLHETVIDLHVVEVDRLRLTVVLGHFEALRHAVNRDDASRAKHPGALHRELPDRAAAPHCDRITRFDAAVFRGHVAGRKYVGQEQHLLVGNPVRNLDRGHVGKRHAQVLGLTARVTAHHVGEPEESGR